MFKIFWYKYTYDLQQFGGDDPRYISMRAWCTDNIGPHRKSWDHKIIYDMEDRYQLHVIFRFKRKEDLVMFKLANL